MSTRGLELFAMFAMLVFCAVIDADWTGVLCALGMLYAIDALINQIGITHRWSCHACGKQHSGSIFREIFIPCDHTPDW